jgi:hypothetical protein
MFIYLLFLQKKKNKKKKIKKKNNNNCFFKKKLKFDLHLILFYVKKKIFWTFKHSMKKYPLK